MDDLFNASPAKLFVLSLPEMPKRDLRPSADRTIVRELHPMAYYEVLNWCERSRTIYVQSPKTCIPFWASVDWFFPVECRTSEQPQSTMKGEGAE